MISRSHLSTLVYVAFGVWALLLLASGGTLPAEWRVLLPWVITTLLVLLWLIDQSLWRVPGVRSWLKAPPNLRGTWKVTLRSNWNDGSAQNGAPIDAYAVIRQTYSSVHVRLLTSESSSDSLSAAFDHARDGGWSLVAVYRNTPGPLVLDRSRPHFGGIIVDGRGLRPANARGHYWTDRATRGEIHMTSRRRKLYDDFESAASAIK